MPASPIGAALDLITSFEQEHLGPSKGTFRPNSLIILASGHLALPSGDSWGDNWAISAPDPPLPAARAYATLNP